MGGGERGGESSVGQAPWWSCGGTWSRRPAVWGPLQPPDVTIGSHEHRLAVSQLVCGGHVDLVDRDTGDRGAR